ncbi:MAG TPA: aminotransferase class I/II-fold pyridoxal phosphate-dependent enzyme [Phenylobacterium sp.]|uniref:aminotransferase class I/II-fold pyridoxal phosphate-dependent enzyme n=1 Tax=Phenylobacterium sp. TaxID=1871053 RepID=UPI002B46974A|nr:aminotransferase class I/II-fold pyridoxal phosphate-dependent enzyme [Phenylobacterium sp.]HKR89256.1 aminotransferase class I/II-fold pyridoxal phosphate-dependent enzyme [Phenylobacterium sp.]
MTTSAELDGFIRHGGRLAAAQAAFPQAPQPWLDLSTGINPRPYPAPRASRAERARLPDPEALQFLEAAAARTFGARPERVAAVPGSETAIRLLPDLLAVRGVAIAPDTYGGHAEAWRAAGAEVSLSPEDAEAWAVVSPNNPDGRITPADLLLSSAGRRWTLVDEAFVETAPELSLAPRAEGRLVVLRSFGKFYGLAGLRLGFVVADEALVASLRRRLGDWPISADAIAAGLAAYADDAWADRTRARLARDATRLDQLLTRSGLTVVGGTSLFRLARAPDARAVFLRLAAAGVLCRPFADPRLLRFGLPGGAAAWARLEAALSERAR